MRGWNDVVPCGTFCAVVNQRSAAPRFESPVEVATTAWMRVHLMGDTALRGRFYGPSCTLCQDTAWQVMRKMMDQ